MNGNILKIQRYSIHDGPGLRTSVFMKGCPLRCLWCHNPESWSFGCVGEPTGRIEDFACGSTMSVEHVKREIERDILFYDESGGGVTFTGGEPLAQSAFLAELLPLLKGEYIHTALDTCGYAPWDSFAAVLPYINLVLFDLKHMDDRQHMELTGVSNGLILSNLQKLAATGANIMIRMPVIPSINTDIDNINAMGFLLHQFGIRRVELLPYHDTGVSKYQKLGMDYPLDVRPPDKALMVSIAEALKGHGLSVRIGGIVYE